MFGFRESKCTRSRANVRKVRVWLSHAGRRILCSSTCVVFLSSGAQFESGTIGHATPETRHLRWAEIGKKYHMKTRVGGTLTGVVQVGARAPPSQTRSSLSICCAWQYAAADVDRPTNTLVRLATSCLKCVIRFSSMSSAPTMCHY